MMLRVAALPMFLALGACPSAGPAAPPPTVIGPSVPGEPGAAAGQPEPVHASPPPDPAHAARDELAAAGLCIFDSSADVADVLSGAAVPTGPLAAPLARD
jgi:hypothetical protein